MARGARRSRRLNGHSKQYFLPYGLWLGGSRDDQCFAYFSFYSSIYTFQFLYFIYSD